MAVVGAETGPKLGWGIKAQVFRYLLITTDNTSIAFAVTDKQFSGGGGIVHGCHFIYYIEILSMRSRYYLFTGGANSFEYPLYKIYLKM